MFAIHRAPRGADLRFDVYLPRRGACLLFWLLAMSGCVGLFEEPTGRDDGGRLAADSRPSDADIAPPDRSIACRAGDTRQCGIQQGVCALAVQVCVDGHWDACPGLRDKRAEMCDGLDNDCDGRVDEEVSPPPAAMQDGVCRGSRQICDGEAGFREPSTQEIAHFEPNEVSCDARDNDCDGAFDEGGLCGRLVEEHCALDIGWANLNCAGPVMTLDMIVGSEPIPGVVEWSMCDPVGGVWCNCFKDLTGEPPMEGVCDPNAPSDAQFICDTREIVVNAGSSGNQNHMARQVRVGRGERRFQLLQFTGDIEREDRMATRLSCFAPSDPSPSVETAEGPIPIERWVETRCAFYLTFANNQHPEDTSLAWGDGGCDRNILQDQLGNFICTSTGRDRLFHTLQLEGGFGAEVSDDDRARRNNVDASDAFGVAWLCTDIEHPRLAAEIESHVEILFGWSNSNCARVTEDTDEDAGWLRDRCPIDESALISTGLDGRFHVLPITAGDLGDNDRFGFALRAR